MFTLGNLELKNEWLNTMILNKALSGHSDCNGPVTINWRFEESFVFSLIEEYTGKWWYRLFVCNDSLFHYSFEKILHPSPDAYNMKYVYDYYFDYKGHERKLLRFVEGDWVLMLNSLRLVTLAFHVISGMNFLILTGLL